MSSKKILLVDDEIILLDVWSRALRREGHEVSAVENGQLALEALAREAFAVVFTDIHMPGMGGKELLELIKKSAQDVCVNVITGAASIADAIECMRLGACDYLQKPCELDELMVLARRCLRHHEERRERKSLYAAVTRYEELDRLRSEFVSNVSHELRTPLFSIQGAFDLL